LPHAGDFEMWLRCAAVADVAEFEAVQGFVRMHDSNMRWAYLGERVLADYRQRRDSYARFFQAYGAGLRDAPELERLAMLSLATDLLWEASRALEAGEPPSELIAAAREISRDVRHTSAYRRLAIKRRLWPLLAPRAAPRAPAPAA
jgi:hypothetical protein